MENNIETPKNDVYIGDASYNPLTSEAPIEKNYHKQNISAGEIPDHIPDFNLVEPKFTPEPNPEELESENKSNSNDNDNSGNFNAAMNDLSPKDKKLASAIAADTAIEGYAFIWKQFLTPLAQFNSKKLEKQIASGEISSRIKIPVDEFNEVPLRTYTESFNENVAQALIVEQDFKDRIREPLIRVLEKKGIGMTDEQFLLLELGKDFVAKTAIVWGIRNSIKEITENFIERTNELKSSSSVSNTIDDESENRPTPPPSENLRNQTTNETQTEKVVETETKGDFVVKNEINQPGSNPSILAHMEEIAKNKKNPQIAKPTTAKRTTRAQAKK